MSNIFKYHISSYIKFRHLCARLLFLGFPGTLHQGIVHLRFESAHSQTPHQLCARCMLSLANPAGVQSAFRRSENWWKNLQRWAWQMLQPAHRGKISNVSLRCSASMLPQKLTYQTECVRIFPSNHVAGQLSGPRLLSARIPLNLFHAQND